MLSAAGQAFRDLFTPPFRAVLFKCVASPSVFSSFSSSASSGLSAISCSGPTGSRNRFSGSAGWRSWSARSSSFAPVTSLIAGLYLDDIAAVVERVHYPADPPGQELPTLQSVGVALRFFIIVLLVSLVALFLLLIPGINLIAFYLGNGYLLGREYFELAAMRHVPPAEAKSLRRANRLTVFLGGLIIAGIASVPILNLITPLFATGFMVRMYKGLARSSGLSLAAHAAK